MNAKTNALTKERMNGRTNERTNKQTNEQTNEQTNKQTNKRSNKRTNKRNEGMNKWRKEVRDEKRTKKIAMLKILIFKELKLSRIWTKWNLKLKYSLNRNTSWNQDLKNDPTITLQSLKWGQSIIAVEPMHWMYLRCTWFLMVCLLPSAF